MDLHTILFGAAQTVIISMVIYYLQRKQRKADEKKERQMAADAAEAAHRAESRRKESLLGLKLNMANAKLGRATAMALKRGRANGEVEEALEAYEDAKQAYFDFLNQQANEHLN